MSKYARADTWIAVVSMIIAGAAVAMFLGSGSLARLIRAVRCPKARRLARADVDLDPAAWSPTRALPVNDGNMLVWYRQGGGIVHVRVEVAGGEGWPGRAEAALARELRRRREAMERERADVRAVQEARGR
jgi:hypothetical protein